MNLDQIITMANGRSRLRFLAMERSLRATGCALPLRVIPYDDDRFPLPEGASWWEVPPIIGWLRDAHARPVMRKYQCLTAANYQFVDADVCFLRNPEEVLEPCAGFVTSCGHWHNPDNTVTTASRRFIQNQTTTWPSRTFNSGQFACDRPLFDATALIATASAPAFVDTCVRFPYHEQPGLNLLVWQSGVPIVNLTLLPHGMESTWAGDYPGGYEGYWRQPGSRPYLIHWAGCRMDTGRPIDEIFLGWLTVGERQEWQEQVRAASAAALRRQRSLRSNLRRVKRGLMAFANELRRTP